MTAAPSVPDPSGPSLAAPSTSLTFGAIAVLKPDVGFETPDFETNERDLAAKFRAEAALGWGRRL